VVSLNLAHPVRWWVSYDRSPFRGSMHKRNQGILPKHISLPLIVVNRQWSRLSGEFLSLIKTALQCTDHVKQFGFSNTRLQKSPCQICGFQIKSSWPWNPWHFAVCRLGRRFVMSATWSNRLARNERRIYVRELQMWQWEKLFSSVYIQIDSMWQDKQQ